MGLVYSFNPLGGPVKISGSIIPTIQLPQDYALAQNANDFSGDPTTATALRSVDSMFYTVIHNEGGDTTQIEVLSLWSNGSLVWTGRRDRMRADSSNPLLLYNSNDSSDSWETSLKTLDSTAGQGKAISYGGSTYNIYSASMLSFATDLNAYIRYSKSGSTLSILIIIPVYVSSLEFRYLAGYIDNADATTDIGSMPISSQSALWLNSTANQYFQTSPIVVNHLAAKALVATG